MSEPWVELQAALQATVNHNERLLALLDQGSPLEALEPHFRAKAELLGQIESQAAAVDQSALQGDQLQALLELEKRAGASETRLSEALAKWPAGTLSVNSVTAAYRSNSVDNLGTKGLDYSS